MASATDNMLILCNVLSATVILACLVLKVPQISAVVKQGSSKGLSLNSVLLELWSYSTMLTYHYAMSYPLPTYLEYAFLVPQDLVLLTVVLHSRGSLTTKTIPLFSLYAVVCYALAFRLVPDLVLTACISVVAPVSMSSKLLQILSMVSTKDAGTVSATTWALATFCTLARSITTLVQTGDMAVLLNFAVSFSLNVAMTTIIIFYRVKKPKKE
ncbi:solute carrier family 66 member 3-like [Babylonia areolata]|uniref:solute carrier family 66 member 3-like n=1 Tax=Babylonia areolata TaxID=304850 RepID=UPI003FCFF396